MAKVKFIPEKGVNVISMEHSKYSFVYPVGKPSEVEVYRFYGRHGEENITDKVLNNALFDLFLEIEDILTNPIDK